MVFRRANILVFLAAIILLSSALPAPGICKAPKKLYFKAEACYQELLDHPSKQKYRSFWKECIDKFRLVHKADPDGPWAAAGLYMSAKLYSELYEHSYKRQDLETARSIFAEIIVRYPHSRYRQKSKEAVENLPAPEKSARELYFKAEACHNGLLNRPERQEYRSCWKDCIEGFEKVYLKHPLNPWAPAAMFMRARLYEELHEHSCNEKDQEKAAEVYRTLVKAYPESRYCTKASGRLGRLEGNEEEETEKAPAVSGENISGRSEGPENEETTVVTGIRYWSNPQYTRVVIDASSETNYKDNLLKKDPSINVPYPRLYVDLNNSRLGEVERHIPINDSLLRDARAGQHNKDTVRVVVDIKSFEDYKIFSLRNPFRIVIDVRGEARTASLPPEVPRKDPIITPFCLGVDKIVVDPGHGGKDYGAPGYLRGVHEKEVVLEISRQLAARLEEELGCEVVLTREGDRYLTLEERTAIANTEKADLFISVHANAARNRRAFGIETYFLNLTEDEEAISVAARENATSKKNISELDSILQDLLNNARINESSRLAACVQKSLCSHLDKRYSRINDKGVKQAPFYVLLGAQMPSILVETSFISNKRECRRLTDPAYQSDICEGIINGVSSYIDQMRPKRAERN